MHLKSYYDANASIRQSNPSVEIFEKLVMKDI